MSDEKSKSIYGLLAGFEKQEQVKEAARRAHEAGYRKLDAYSPFPVKHLVEKMGHKPDKKVQLCFLAGGVSGAFLAYFLQAYSTAVYWRLDVGGKPLNSWPMYIPITFEMTVLLSSIFGFLGMLAFNRLPQPYHPVFNVPEFRRASRDRYFLAIEAEDPCFDAERTWRFLESLNPYYLAQVEK